MTRRRPTSARSGQRQAGSDAGFTLIELMASLTLMAIGIVGVIGVMNSSFSVVNTATARSRATAVATKQIEDLRSRLYETNRKEAELNVNGSYQTREVPVAGQKFIVKHALTEQTEVIAADDGTSTPKAYVKAIVWVNWTDSAGPHDIYQTSLLYPGGLGVHNATSSVQPSGSNTKPLKPSSLTATPVTGTASVDLAWVPPAVTPSVPPPARWVIQYSRTTSFAAGEVQEIAADLAASVNALRVTGLAEGTTYHFRIFSKSENGVLSQEAASALNVTTQGAGAVACSVGTTSVTPSAIKKRGGNDSSRLTSNPQVEVQLVGDCSASTFQIEYSPQDGLTRTVALTPVPLRTRTLTAPVNGNEAVWVVGDRPIDVYSYTAGVKKLRASMRLIVCDNNRPVCP